MTATRAIATLGLLGLVAVSCAATSQQPGRTASPIAVTASAEGLALDGRDWWPAGLNAPQLGTDWSVNHGCGAEVNPAAFFASLPAHSLTRVNLFQSLSINKYSGQWSFYAADKVFAAAELHGQMILPVLAPQDGACDDELDKERDWFVDGWRTARPIFGRSRVSFAEWVSTAVQRWRGSPSLAGWELVGEPDPGICVDGDCQPAARVCPADSAQVLRTFMDEAGAMVRELDPGRLVFAGLIGGGQCGTAGDDYALVGDSPAVDVLEYHDYGADGVALPGDQWNGLGRRIEQARSVGKPLLVAELGQRAGSCLSLDDRRADIGVKITGQRAAGTAGVLLWAFVPDPRLEECTMDIGPDDPLLALLAARNTHG